MWEEIKARKKYANVMLESVVHDIKEPLKSIKNVTSDLLTDEDLPSAPV